MSINVSKTNKYYTAIEDVLLTKDLTLLVYYPEGKTSVDYHVPKTVIAFEILAFTANEYLASITILESVREFNFNTFHEYPKLTIHGAAGSYAEWHAQENGIPFKYI
jgi:hypothetical protein